jgi:hypothetical protein
MRCRLGNGEGGIEILYEQTLDIGLRVQLDIIHFPSLKRLLNDRSVLIADCSFEFCGTALRTGRMTGRDYSSTLYTDVIPVSFFN